MRHSENRIITTHTGSLQRPPDLLALIQAREAGEPVDVAAFETRLRSAVVDSVRQQVAAGIDIVSDGELGKPNFATYVVQRIGGFTGSNPEPRTSKDAETFPEWAGGSPGTRGIMRRHYCTEPLTVRDTSAVQADIANLGAAMQASGGSEAFLPSASPGIIADIMVNRYYPSEEAYLFALADALHVEYQAITDAGFILQIDAPDAAMGRHMQFRNDSLEDFRKATAMRIAALNHGLAGIPEEQVRFHVCWGNNESPHVHDVPLKDIVDLVLSVNAGAYSIEAANPRHAHEWRLWEDVKLPDGKLLIPGIIDSTTNFVEHPELVAQRIEQFASVVGAQNVIAGTDCGFGTSASRTTVHPEIVWHKLHALAEGAEIASQRLFR